MREPREPKPLALLLRTLVAGRGWGERLAVGKLLEAWTDVVGAHIAPHSEPLRLVRGTLTVRADPGAWATELALLASQVAQRADLFLGGGLVREVRVTAGTPARDPAS